MAGIKGGEHELVVGELGSFGLIPGEWRDELSTKLIGELKCDYVNVGLFVELPEDIM